MDPLKNKIQEKFQNSSGELDPIEQKKIPGLTNKLVPEPHFMREDPLTIRISGCTEI